MDYVSKELEIMWDWSQRNSLTARHFRRERVGKIRKDLVQESPYSGQDLVQDSTYSGQDPNDLTVKCDLLFAN